jgi:hypothetical protein
MNGMLTLFISATSEGWADIMHDGVDAVGINHQPQPEHNFGWSIFFIVFVLFGNFFMLNLLVGVVIEKYTHEKNFEHGIIFLSNIQKEYVLIQAFMLNSKPLVIRNPPKNWIRGWFFRIAENPNFDGFIMTCIILNSVALAMKWYSESETQVFVIDMINLVFTTIFTAEATVKIAAYKSEYFAESWNRFDFFIVCVSLVEIAVT